MKFEIKAVVGKFVEFLAVCWQKFSYAVRGKPAISRKLKAKNRAKTTQFSHVLQANLQHNQATFVKIVYHKANLRRKPTKPSKIVYLSQGKFTTQ